MIVAFAGRLVGPSAELGGLERVIEGTAGWVLRKHLVFLEFQCSFGCDAVRLVRRSDSGLKKSFKRRK